MADKSELTIIGIGYVGLPLAISLAKFFYVNAYDLNKNRIAGLKKNYDITNEFSSNEIKYIRQKKFVIPVNLGPRILRSDTAVVSALVIWQLFNGDMRHK